MKDCQDITELLERSKLERISLRERLAIRFHNAICKGCRQYFLDSNMLDEMLRSKRFRHLSDYSFSTEEKAHLKKVLQTKSDT